MEGKGTRCGMNVLTKDDLKDILKISEKQAIGLMRMEGFPSFKIGREYRVTEEKLVEWMNTLPDASKLNYW